MPDATKAPPPDKDKGGGAPPPAPAAEKVPPQEAAPAVDPALVHAFAAALKVVQGDAPKAGPPVATADIDKAEPGGKFIVDGKPVNAWGKPFKAGQDPHADDPEAIPGG